MLNPEKHAAPVFAALGDPTRLELVSRLGNGQTRSISELCQGLRISRQGITKHLRVLELAGLVRSERVGRESKFTAVRERIADAQAYLDNVSLQWDAALSRLQTFVDAEQQDS